MKLYKSPYPKIGVSRTGASSTDINSNSTVNKAIKPNRPAPAWSTFQKALFSGTVTLTKNQTFWFGSIAGSSWTLSFYNGSSLRWRKTIQSGFQEPIAVVWEGKEAAPTYLETLDKLDQWSTAQYIPNSRNELNL